MPCGAGDWPEFLPCFRSRVNIACQCFLNLTMMDIVATESTKKHGKNQHPLKEQKKFPYPSVMVWISWL